MPLMTNMIQIEAQIPNWPTNIDQIDLLEYFIEFSPSDNDYSTTNYSLIFEDIEINGEKMKNISIYYNNPDLTMNNSNFSYNMSVDSYEIINVSNSYYEEYLSNHKTEILCNISSSNIGNPQTYRVDETIIFAPYLKTTDNEISGFKEIETEFQYIGEEKYNTKLIFTMDTYHYNAYFSWTDTYGC